MTCTDVTHSDRRGIGKGNPHALTSAFGARVPLLGWDNVGQCHTPCPITVRDTVRTAGRWWRSVADYGGLL